MRFFNATPRIVIGENSSVPGISGFLVRDIPARHDAGGRSPVAYCLVDVSGFAAVFGIFGLAGAALAAALSLALDVVSPRMVPQGSADFCSCIFPKDRL